MTEDQLKHTYRVLLKKYHPDTGGQTADESAIRRIIEEYKKLSSRRSSKSDNISSNDISKDKSRSSTQLTAWTTPASTDDTDKFILSMLSLIADRRAEEMPTDIIAAHISFCTEHSTDEGRILTLTALAEIAELTRQTLNEYDINCETMQKQISDYARHICEAANYLDRLSAVNAPKSNLIRDILRSIKLCSSENLKELLNAVLIFVVSLEI